MGYELAWTCSFHFSPSPSHLHSLSSTSHSYLSFLVLLHSLLCIHLLHPPPPSPSTFPFLLTLLSSVLLVPSITSLFHPPASTFPPPYISHQACLPSSQYSSFLLLLLLQPLPSLCLPLFVSWARVLRPDLRLQTGPQAPLAAAHISWRPEGMHAQWWVLEVLLTSRSYQSGPGTHHRPLLLKCQ